MCIVHHFPASIMIDAIEYCQPYHANHIRYISHIGNLHPINSTYTYQPLKRPLTFKANLVLHGMIEGKTVRYACIIVKLRIYRNCLPYISRVLKDRY